MFLAVGILVAICTILDVLLKGPLLELKDHKGISSFIFIPSQKQKKKKEIFPCFVKKIAEGRILDCYSHFPVVDTTVTHDHTYPAHLSLHIVHSE